MGIFNKYFDPSYEFLPCKGGGGGGSGTVDYPAHMKAWHTMALDDGGADTLATSMTDVMDAAIGNSPWTAASAYNPDLSLVEMITATNNFETLVNLLSSGTTLDTLISNVLDQTRIDNKIAAYTIDLGARMLSEVLPRFEAGMRDINAVVSSAFVIGRALIEENNDRQVAKFSADLNMKSFSDDAIQVIGLKLQYQQAVTQTIVETNRIKIVAKKEQNDMDIDINDSDAKWDLEVFQYGANLLASIGGGTALAQKSGASKTQSVLGGAMSGAAAGAMVGSAVPGIGTAVGAVVGGVLGAASGLL